jgi:hypothetical protein
MNSARLEWFAEGFLRFVMLVAVVFVKFVRAFADYIGPDRHALAAVLARPVFGGGEQLRSRSQAALPFGYDQSVHFRTNIAFEKGLSTHMEPADHPVLGGIRHKNGVLRRGVNFSQSRAHLLCGRGISKLARERRKLRRIGGFRPPDFQAFAMSHTRSLGHTFFL